MCGTRAATPSTTSGAGACRQDGGAPATKTTPGNDCPAAGPDPPQGGTRRGEFGARPAHQARRPTAPHSRSISLTRTRRRACDACSYRTGRRRRPRPTVFRPTWCPRVLTACSSSSSSLRDPATSSGSLALFLSRACAPSPRPLQSNDVAGGSVRGSARPLLCRPAPASRARAHGRRRRVHRYLHRRAGARATGGFSSWHAKEQPLEQPPPTHPPTRTRRRRNECARAQPAGTRASSPNKKSPQGHQPKISSTRLRQPHVDTAASDKQERRKNEGAARPHTGCTRPESLANSSSS